MNVTPFDLAVCPRVSARHARATQAVLATLAELPASWEIDLPPLGRAAITLAGVTTMGGVPSALAFVVASGAEVGRLTIDPALATGLVDAALGGQGVFRSVRTLGLAERGVLAGLLAPVLDPIGWTIGLGSAPPPHGAGAPILFRLETPAGSGNLELEVPGAPLRASGTDELGRRAARLAVVARVEIAVTKLSTAAAVGLGPGDAVVFEGVRADTFSGGADVPWPACLAIGSPAGGYSLPIRIDAHGAMNVVGGFSICKQESEMDGSGTSDAIAEATAVLAAAPIEVVAELGRITLRGDQVMGLAPGTVLTLGAGRGSVSLRVGGEPWAEGEIVDVEGELGVRVTRVHGNGR